ncbi:sulfite exporter TauE/SafE family protein [Arcticibacter tournemirensis]|uniref:Probable membrane transporter protein n=1 Tax=Arcticibacter tournemirensis TaxID=699437 RepID=A0A4Q0MBV2_9SPHI|nr:sulfite exporter TauE/SafE family protein [Arcticibacter tournemirensis]RXF70645.1 sulfite exporter TauE/SafE family protein [Arcticibacter tournemirensis]
MELTGYIASALIGIFLGLIGGGGSILTVPVMVYLFGIPPLLATSYSLFIVGTTSLIGAVNNLRKGQVNLRAALFFGASSVITVFITRKFIVPAIPKNIVTIGEFTITEPFLTMILFGTLMLLASFSMIRDHDKSSPEKECSDCIKFFKLTGYGVSIGLVTGFLGAGGGFLLIPALIFLIKLPMKKAIGTSLFIIALNSLVGFAGDLGHFTIDWQFLSVITLIAIAGIFIGGLINKRIPGEKLKKGFGWFVLIMGLYIIVKEVLS